MLKSMKTILIATALPFLMTAIAQANADHCVNGAKRSKNSNTPTSIRFRAVGENDETQFKIYWIDFNGRPKFYKHIFAGDSYVQQTYLTHPWLVTAPVPGGGEDCIRTYMPKKQRRTVTLK